MIRLLALLCCVLLAVIAGEVLMPDGATTEGAVAAPPRPGGTRIAPIAPAPAIRAQWVTEVLARPLFSPNRRPAAGAAVASTEASLPRLAGVIGTPEGVVAIFQPDGEAKPLLVHGGDHVGAWEVTRIEPGAVYLERGADRMVVNPHFSMAPPVAPALGGALGAPPAALGVPPPPIAPGRR